MNKPMDTQPGHDQSGQTDGAPRQAARTPVALPWWQDRRNQLVMLAALLAIAMAVIFWLPKAVQPPPPQDPADVPAAAAAAPSKPIESPWSDAQLAKERRRAQDILAQILKKQESLEAMSVTLWAPAAYQQAMTAAADGDAYYRQRQFEQAQSNYQSSLAQFDQLLLESEQVFSGAIGAGGQAIDQGQPEEAVTQFTLAAAIKPGDDTAQQGLARARVLGQVLELLEQGRQLQDRQQYEQAQQAIEQALALDAASAPARAALSAIKQAIKDRDFARAMSEGYAALQSQRFAAAKKSFQQALKVRPGASEAANALTQTQNQHTQTQIQSYLSRAAGLESREQWREAGDNYSQALKLDKNLVAARIGQIRSEARAKLDQSAEAILADPLRLADPAVYQRGRSLFADMQAIADPGQRLRRQTDRLAVALEQAQQPIAVRLQSDNLTQVTLYRVGNLGNFVNRELSLKPGRYTAVGIREGYRDVRREFSVAPGSAIETIVIQCVEKISLDG